MDVAAASGAVLAASDAAVFDDGSTASDVRISGLRGRTETVGPALPQCARCDLCLTVLQLLAAVLAVVCASQQQQPERAASTAL